MLGNWHVLFGKGPTEKDSSQEYLGRRATPLSRAGAGDFPRPATHAGRRRGLMHSANRDRPNCDDLSATPSVTECYPIATG